MITEQKIIKKHYFGSASAKNKIDTGQKIANIEGIELDIPSNNMTVAEKLEEIKQDLSSSISYSGGKDISAFKDVEWKIIK